jgi:TetR/AcrR family transcriptional regulator
VLGVLTSEKSLDEKIDGLIATYIDNLVLNPFLPGYLLSELHHQPDRVAQFLAAASGGTHGQAIQAAFVVVGRQIKEAVDAGTMRPIAPQQFFINLISLCIFPFAARPMLSIALGMDDAAFTRFMEQRPHFFWQQGAVATTVRSVALERSRSSKWMSRHSRRPAY